MSKITGGAAVAAEPRLRMAAAIEIDLGFRDDDVEASTATAALGAREVLGRIEAHEAVV